MLTVDRSSPIGRLSGLLITLVAFASSNMVSSSELHPNSSYLLKDHGVRTPVIGVLTQVLRDYQRFVPDKHLHLVSSYVKWIESSGAQALPILLNQNDQYYERVFRETNGLLLPGGDNLLNPHKDTPMMVAAKKLYHLAVEANNRGDFYPIWGTCLGLELLSVLTAGRNVLESCSANDMSLRVDFADRGRMFAPSSYANLPMSGDYSAAIMETLKTRSITYHFHHKCLTDAGLRSAGLADFYRPLAYSVDKLGKRFITIFEAFKYPFYGVQFHPEKPAFEFMVKKSQQHIVHSRDAIAVSRYFADFFVASAQMSQHQATNKTARAMELIYSHTPMYTGLLHDMYEQRYLFPYKDNGLTKEEFLDFVPDETYEPPE